MPPQNKKISCAILGLGFWGKVFLKKILVSDEFELKAVASRKISVDLKDQLKGVVVYKTAEDLLEHTEIDLVFVLSSLDQHVRVAELALARSIDVFLTKPITPSVKDALILQKLAAKNKAKIFVDHTFLFNPIFLEFKRRATLKQPTAITAQRTQFGRFQKGSDVLGELQYHDIYMSLAVMGESKPRAVRAIGSANHVKELDQCMLEIDFKSASAQLFGSMNFIQKQKSMTILSGGKIFSWNDIPPQEITEAKYHFAFGQDGVLDAVKQHQISTPKNDAIDAMLEHIADCLQQNKKSRLVDISHGIQIMKIIEAARRSSRTNSKVKL